MVDRDAVDRRVRLDTVVHERDRAAFAAALEKAKQRQADIAPLDTVLPGNDDRHIRFYVNAIADGAGGEGAEETAIVYAVETTEQKALEIKMAQGQKMQAVGQLAGGIAHDFNNVLTAIIMASDLLLTNHRPSDPSFPDIMNIKQNANRAASLVRQLLAFSRKQTLRPEVLNLTDVLADLGCCCRGWSATTSSSRSIMAATCGRCAPTSASSSRSSSTSPSTPATPCRTAAS